jgi:hypothetical protein
MGSFPRCYKEENWSKNSERVVGEFVKRKLSWCSREPAGNEVSAEAEESPLLEAVSREQLVKTQQTEKI